MEKSSGRRRASLVLHSIGEATSRASAAAIVLMVVIIFLVVAAVEHFASGWENGFSMAASAITLIMVFVIQHTQSRQQVATQLKLDELIRAAPRADDLLIHVESAGDEELIAMVKEGADQHSAIREGAPSDGHATQGRSPTGPVDAGVDRTWRFPRAE